MKLEKKVYHAMLPMLVSGYVEMHEFELNGIQHILNWLKTSNIDEDIKTEKIQEYEKLYNETHTCMQILNSEIIKEYIPEEYQTDRYSIYINYVDSGVFVLDELSQT